MTKTSDRPPSRRGGARHVEFSIGGGCFSIAASNSGAPLGQDALVTLAKAAAGRIH